VVDSVTLLDIRVKAENHELPFETRLQELIEILPIVKINPKLTLKTLN
jgi:hypothetical protein